MNRIRRYVEDTPWDARIQAPWRHWSTWAAWAVISCAAAWFGAWLLAGR